MIRHLKIDGMSCQHCVHAVERTLAGVPGTRVERVELGAAWVGGDYDEERLREALDDAGFALLSLEKPD